MENLKQIGHQLLLLDNYIIIGHSFPDGDSIGSILALYLGLSKLGKNVEIVLQDPLPQIYTYLAGSGKFCRPDEIRVDTAHVIFLDCSDLNRVGEENLDYLSGRELTINIDHHQDNSMFGDYNFVNPAASSVAEIMYELLTIMEIPITADIADCLYAGIVMDSGSFMNSNTSSETLRTASCLVDKGANIDKTRNNLLESKALEEILLISQALQHLELYRDGKIACMTLAYEDVERIGAINIHPEGIINYARCIRGVEIALLLREASPGVVKIGFRSKNDIDVARLAAELGGGGHKRAAGATQEGDLNQVKRSVIKLLEKVVG